jgi:hypothetical protein
MGVQDNFFLKVVLKKKVVEGNEFATICASPGGHSIGKKDGKKTLNIEQNV